MKRTFPKIIIHQKIETRCEGSIKAFTDDYTIYIDLEEHPQYGPEATELMEILESSDAKRITERICRRLPRSHHLVLSTSSYSAVEDFRFLDIETLGLKNQAIIILG
ncbi:MAG: hypothetical protein FJ150_08140 [Euryarchaeota archaeon]|nr:hypothetical protein [Euryarchaeota archaeon]